MLLSKNKIRELRKLAAAIKEDIGSDRWELSHSGRVVIEGTDKVVAHAHGSGWQDQRRRAEGIVLSHNHIQEFMWAFMELTGGDD